MLANVSQALPAIYWLSFPLIAMAFYGYFLLHVGKKSKTGAFFCFFWNIFQFEKNRELFSIMC
jgi:hypothetical protein